MSLRMRFTACFRASLASVQEPTRYMSSRPRRHRRNLGGFVEDGAFEHVDPLVALGENAAAL